MAGISGTSWVLLAAEALGAAASILVAARLYRVYRLLGDSSILFMSVSFAVLGLALGLELGGNAASIVGAVDAAPGRPAQVTLLLANRGVLLASPLYIAAYTLYAVSIYLEHVPVQRGPGLVVGAPLLLEVYVDNNIVSLAILAIAAYLVATRGGARPALVVLLSLLGMSHVLLIVAGIRVDAMLMLYGLMLRAAAPVAFAACTMLLGGRRG